MTPTPNLTSPPQESLKPKPTLMGRLQEFIARYGMLAVVVHWGLFFIFLGGFMLLIHAGFKVDSAAGAAGTFAGAYLACQAIKIPRFALTFAVTPLIDRLIQRLRHKSPKQSP